MSDIKLELTFLNILLKSQILIYFSKVAFNMILRHQAEAFIKFVPEKAEAAICK